jgi:hypothetical protein
MPDIKKLSAQPGIDQILATLRPYY